MTTIAKIGVLVVVLAATACSGSEPQGSAQVAPADTGATATSADATGSAEEGGSGATGDSTGSQAPADTATSSGPIASLDTAGPVTGGDELVALRIDVLSLQRATGDTAQLRFSITNQGTDAMSLGSNLGEGANSYDVSAVSLVDLTNDMRYLVMLDSDDQCLCTQLETSIATVEPLQSRTFEATFPAPPPEVSIVDVQIAILGTVRDVPLAAGNG
jgi:hypothetical protein